MEDLDFAHYKVFQMEQFFLSQVTLLQTKHSTSRKNPVDTNSILILFFKLYQIYFLRPPPPHSLPSYLYM